MTTNDVLIMCTAASIVFIAVAVICLFLVPAIDRMKYRKYLTFMREDVSHKMNKDEQDEVRDWYNNKLMYLRYSKLPNKHRVLSPYQFFIVFFTVGVLLSFIPFSIYDDTNCDSFTNFFKTIFLTIRSFFWGSSFEKLQPINGGFSLFYLHYMSIIFVVAGLVVAFSIFKLFKEFFAYLKYWTIHPLSDIYVFSKLNEKSIALAEDIFKNEKPIKTIKKLDDRKTDNEQKIIYIENEYKYAIAKNKKKVEAKRKRRADIRFVLENLETKKRYVISKSTFKSAIDSANYTADTLKQYKDDMKTAKAAYRKEKNYLLVNAVERGWVHIIATIKTVFINLVMFLFCSLGALILSSIFALIFILEYILYFSFLIPIEILYILSCVFGFKAKIYTVKEKYSNVWKRCQVFIAKSTLQVLEFLGAHSKWFDKLFHKRYIYFCDVYSQVTDSHDELIDRVKYIGATVMKRDVTELRMKWWCRSRTIYLISDNDNENTEHATYLLNACTRSITQKEMLNNMRTEIYVFASNDESEFIVNDLNNKLVKERVWDIVNNGTCHQERKFNNKSFDIMRIRRINEYSNFATSFFWNRYNKFFYGNNTDLREINVAMIGCGRYGKEFVKTLCCLGQLPNHKIAISIFDKNIEKVKASFPEELTQNGLMPLFADEQVNGKPIYTINFEQCSVNVNDSEFLKQISLECTHIFVMLGDDELNIRTSMLLRKKFRREKTIDSQPLIYTVVNDYQRHYNLKQGDELYKYEIKPIGRTITRYSERAIQQKDIERWARVVHTSFMLNDILSNNLANLFPKCNEYKNRVQKKENETIFDILDKKCVGFINTTYPFISHEIYRLWQIIVANKIRYIDFDNLYDIWNLICEIKETVLVDKQRMRLRLLEEMEFILKDHIDKDTIQRVSSELFDSVILPWLNEIVSNFVPFEKVFDFDSREYLRRSSKARALYEHILFKKDMIKYDEKNHVVINKCDKLRVWFANDEDGEFIKHRWENKQWIALNDLMQKRWIAFMWGEGFSYKEEYDDGRRSDAIEKTHKYIKPFNEICKSEQDKTRQTLEIIHVID